MDLILAGFGRAGSEVVVLIALIVTGIVILLHRIVPLTSRGIEPLLWVVCLRFLRRHALLII